MIWMMILFRTTLRFLDSARDDILMISICKVGSNNQYQTIFISLSYWYFMSKITDQILYSVDIVDYISKYVKLTRAWSNYTGLCPFHNEKTPSFMVSDSKQIFKCFWCGKGGNVITFAMEYERTDFVDTVKHLAQYANVPLTDFDYQKNDDFQILKALNQKAVAIYKLNLRQDKNALEYLSARHIDQDLIQEWDIWYAKDSYYDLSNQLKKENFTTQSIITSWLAKHGNSGDIFDFFKHRIIFPIRDHIGNFIWFAGRVINPEDTPKYLNISDNILYDKSKTLYWLYQAKQHLKSYDKFIVVEWYMDVIWLSRVWLPVWVATCGTALTVDHFKILKRHTPNIIFLFDNDDAWFQATIRWLKVAYKQDTYPKIVNLPHLYKDVDDLANDNNLILENKQKIFDHPTDGMSWVVDSFVAKYDMTNPVEKKKITNELFEIISNIADLSILQMYIELISDKIRTDSNILFSQYKIRLQQSRQYITKQSPRPSSQELDPRSLFDSLIRDGFYKTHFDESSISKIDQIIYYYDQVQKVLKDHDALEISEEDSYLADQLWREHQFTNMTNTRKIDLVYNFGRKTIDGLLKKILKISSIDQETKMWFLDNRKKLWW